MGVITGRRDDWWPAVVSKVVNNVTTLGNKIKGLHSVIAADALDACQLLLTCRVPLSIYLFESIE